MNRGKGTIKGADIAKKLMAIFFLPVLVYLVLLIIDGTQGVVYNIFSGDALASILRRASYMTIVALGIGFQLKYGRFDFSGGAIIVVSATVGGVIADALGANWLVMTVFSIMTGVILSVINSLVYSIFRIPISVISLAMAYLFESLPGIILGGNAGPGITYNPSLNAIGTFPLILLPFFMAVILYVVYDKFTVAGRQSMLLNQNQLAAVNIGINEKKNTVICYVVTGFIFGLAGAIYAAQNFLGPITSPLQTTGTLFSNIIPSLFGLFLSRYINDGLGTFVGALTITILYYGLELIGVKSGMRTLCYACFLAAFILISGFWDHIIPFFIRKFKQLAAKLKPKKEIA